MRTRPCVLMTKNCSRCRPSLPLKRRSNSVFLNVTLIYLPSSCRSASATDRRSCYFCNYIEPSNNNRLNLCRLCARTMGTRCVLITSADDDVVADVGCRCRGAIVISIVGLGCQRRAGSERTECRVADCFSAKRCATLVSQSPRKPRTVIKAHARV